MTPEPNHSAGDYPTATPYSLRFLALVATHFLGAANAGAMAYWLLRVERAAPPAWNLPACLALLLILVLCVPLAGSLADVYCKQRFFAVVRSLEIPVVGLVLLAGAPGKSLLSITLFGVIALIALQRVLIGPVTYGLLPESLPDRHLSTASAALLMTTAAADLAGLAAGVAWLGQSRGDTGWLFLGVAIVGTLCALYVPRTPPGARDRSLGWKPLGAVRHDWHEARRQAVLFQTILGIGFFGYLLAASPAIPVRLLVDPAAPLWPLALPAFGFTIGCLAAARLSRGKVEIGLVPLGALGMAAAVLLQAAADRPDVASLAIAGMGLAAGIYIVPLCALLLQRSPAGMKGRLVAFALAFFYVGLSLGFLLSPARLVAAGLTTRQALIVLGLLLAGVTVYILSLLPEFAVRLVLLLVVRTFYRVEVGGLENVPRGGALFVANHVSWVDALLIGTSSDRIPRFMLFRPIYQARGLHRFFKKMHVIPVSKFDTDEQKEASLELAREQIRQGHVVCIFAEGAISRTGNLLKFRRGFERIARGVDAPIVPIALDGVWGSIFSWEQGKLLFKWPRRTGEPVRVLFGPPLPPTTGADDVRRAVQQLTVRAFELRKAQQRPLGVEIVRTAKRFWRRPFVFSGSGDGHGNGQGDAPLRFGQCLMRGLALRDGLYGADGREAGREDDVGLLLPQGVPAVLANIAMACAGRPLVNLELDATAERLRRQLAATGIRRVLTSRDVLPRLPGQTALGDCDVVYVEDLPQHAGAFATFFCRWLPRALVARWVVWGERRNVDGAAAVVFSASPRLAATSGGVLLSHHNVLSNLESLKQVFRISREDRILGVLPFWNAFGLTGTLLLPAIAGVGVAHHDPADLGGVERLVRDRRISVLPLPSWHVDGFTAQLPAESFAQLRHAVVSGGLLTPAQRVRFTDKFGVEPLEGFGTPECAPLVSLNFPVLERVARGQPSHRPGTSGQTLPGVAARVVDPASGEERPSGRSGVLEVQGPNVMQGYLGEPGLTASVFRDGWYRTEYLALLDPDGFLTVLGLIDDGVPAAARRPRDAYGRPLPAGSADVLGAVEPGPVVRGPGEALARARALFDEWRFFEAHEFFEYLWKSPQVPDRERGFWRGLAQLAAGCCHAQRGNPAGAIALLARAVALLGTYPAEYQGIDTARLIDETNRMKGRIQHDGAGPEPTFGQLPLAGEESRA